MYYQSEKYGVSMLFELLCMLYVIYNVEYNKVFNCFDRVLTIIIINHSITYNTL